MSDSTPCIPVGYAWSSPFVRWGGAIADFSSLDVGVAVTTSALNTRGLEAASFGSLVLGWTVPQPEIFYGAPTLAARIGAPNLTGPMVSQACATGVAAVQSAVGRVEDDGSILVVGIDRTSNAPHLVYGSSSRPGGAPITEDWLLDNFARDPWAGLPMIDTAEAVIREGGFSRQQVDDLVLLRHGQYETTQSAQARLRYLVEISLNDRRNSITIADDVGVRPTTAESLAARSAVRLDGVHTSESQTFPADGCAGLVVTTRGRLTEFPGVRGVADILGIGWARAEKGRMPKAPVPAAYRALERAGLTMGDVQLVVTHNPFAANDLWFAQETSFPLERMNTYGCSLIYGHPQAPTAIRGIAELIEALSVAGGGIGLFTGCAAGDTAGALVVRVE